MIRYLQAETHDIKKKYMSMKFAAGDVAEIKSSLLKQMDSSTATIRVIDESIFKAGGK